MLFTDIIIFNEIACIMSYIRYIDEWMHRCLHREIKYHYVKYMYMIYTFKWKKNTESCVVEYMVPY